MGSCASLNDAARSGYVAFHDGLMRAVARVLECASLQHCRRNAVEYVLRPIIERQLNERKPYIRLGNLVVEAPGGDFDAGRLQLLQRMRELASAAPWLDAVYGVVTDGVRAEYYALGRGGPGVGDEGQLGQSSGCGARQPLRGQGASRGPRRYRYGVRRVAGPLRRTPFFNSGGLRAGCWRRKTKT